MDSEKKAINQDQLEEESPGTSRSERGRNISESSDSASKR